MAAVGALAAIDLRARQAAEYEDALRLVTAGRLRPMVATNAPYQV